MTRNTMLPSVAMLIAIAMTASACEIDVLPVVDCSGIDQPDMGGLVCLGLNMAALQALLALLALIAGGVAGAL